MAQTSRSKGLLEDVMEDASWGGWGWWAGRGGLGKNRAGGREIPERGRK